MKVYHQNLGEIEINEDCLHAEYYNPDTTSCFVLHDGEVKEVSRACLSFVPFKK